MSDFCGRITVYSIAGCRHCLQAKSTLSKHDLPYTDVSIDRYPDLRDFVMERTGKTTVPQIFFNDRHIGGNQELQELVQNNDKFREEIDRLRVEDVNGDAPPLADPSTAFDEAGNDNDDLICEPDPNALLVSKFRESGIPSRNRTLLRCHDNTFKGFELAKWVASERHLADEDAVEFCQKLVDLHFVLDIGNEGRFRADSTLYHLLQDEPSVALNSGQASSCVTFSVDELGENIRRKIIAIYNTFLSSDGKAVDYEGISKSAEFASYRKLVAELNRLKIEDATTEEKLAFFINIYNALVIHGNIVNGRPTSAWQRYKFFNNTSYIIGGALYSLQDIENGILRSNRKGVGMLFRPFRDKDLRKAVMLERPEPLIHFALVCGAKSCPAIQTYSSQEVVKQLKIAAQGFLEDPAGCLIEKNSVKLSKIMKWYQGDFGNTEKEVLQFVEAHLSASSQKKATLSALLKNGQWKVSFLPYNWSANTKS